MWSLKFKAQTRNVFFGGSSYLRLCRLNRDQRFDLIAARSAVVGSWEVPPTYLIHGSEKRRVRMLLKGANNIYIYIAKLTTASQSGGWVPETSRSFHYWQPAARWRPLPWLANPGNPAMSPHAEGEKKGTRHTDKTVERKGEGEGRRLPWSPHAQEKR